MLFKYIRSDTENVPDLFIVSYEYENIRKLYRVYASERMRIRIIHLLYTKYFSIYTRYLRMAVRAFDENEYMELYLLYLKGSGASRIVKSYLN